MNNHVKPTNTHTVFWNTQGRRPLVRTFDMIWDAASKPVFTTDISNRPLKSFDFDTLQNATSEKEIEDLLSDHCIAANDCIDAEFSVVRRELPSGHIYAKMCRNDEKSRSILDFTTPLSHNQLEERTAHIHQCEILLGRLTDISRSVQMDDRNAKTFGDEFRNLLILCCTEFEAISKSILRAHNSPSNNIVDFFKLEKPCRLSEYEISLRRFPGLSILSPFGVWGQQAGYERLDWYKAYNDTKHDRISNITEANLINCVSALSGVIAILCASYGWPPMKNFTSIRENIEIKRSPSFDLSECYLVDHSTNIWGIDGKLEAYSFVFDNYEF